jgi:hypothetical protein
MTTEYPKIETLFDRSKETFTVIDGALRLPEFDLINRWHVTEKVDGTNIRVSYVPRWNDRYEEFYTNEDGARSSRGVKDHIFGPSIQFNGRTDKAQMQPNVQEILDFLFPSVEPFADLFSVNPAVIYGEAYGAGVQKGGNYRKNVGFRIFDVRVGDIFLNWDNVEAIAETLGVATVPVLHPSATLKEAIALVPCNSVVATSENSTEYEQEGIIARTDPGLLTRRGHRIIWKLKNSDYRAGKR